jgi:phage-related protein
MAWTVEYYMDSRGKEPVADFLDALPVEAQAKILRLIDLLGDYGVLLKEPYTKHIRGKLRKLRISVRFGDVRILYFAYADRRLILLHGFVKKTSKMRTRDIEIAEKRLNDFMNREGGLR